MATKWTKLSVVGLDQLMKKIQGTVDALDADLAEKLGSEITYEMRNQMDKGISPIAGAGRFPEYKAVAELNKAKRIDKKVKDLKRADKTTLGKLRQQFGLTKHSAKDLKTLKAHSSQIKKDAKRGYPYNTKEYREGSKRPRPVNLLLTGDFWMGLTYKLVKAGEGFSVAIGFINDKKNVLKELGHREGAGGQPKRPIIPQGDEKFSRFIMLRIDEIFRNRIKEWLKK